MTNTKVGETVVEKKQDFAGPKVANRKSLDNTLQAVVRTCQILATILIKGAVILFVVSEGCSIKRDFIERKRIKQSNKR